MARTQDFTNVVGHLADPTAVKLWADLVADLTALRTAFVTLTAQLDADGGVADTDYAANCDPAALATKL